MKQLSLRLRSTLLAIVLLGFFAPFTVIILDDAYTKSLTQAKMSELRLMNLGLLSAFELDGDVPYMPEILYEEQLNLPGSGFLGLIVFKDKVIWQSASALEYTFTPPDIDVSVGNELFIDSYFPSFKNDTSFLFTPLLPNLPQAETLSQCAFIFSTTRRFSKLKETPLLLRHGNGYLLCALYFFSS